MAFGDLVTTLLKARHLTQRQFAKALAMKQPQIAQIIHGKYPMPQHRIADWIKALGLHGEEAEGFRIEALLTQCPEEIRVLVADLRKRPQRRS